MRIAISGVGNTGKTTLIRELNKQLEFKTLGEVARKNMHILDKYGQSLFQEAILGDEMIRIEYIQSNFDEYEFNDLLIDRTLFDNLIYCYYYLSNGQLDYLPMQKRIGDYIKASRNIYDYVILLTEPFHNSRNFEFTTQEYFVNLFNSSIKQVYGCKVVEFRNGGDIDKILEFINNNL